MQFYSDTDWLTWVDRLSEKDYVIIDNFLPVDLYQQMRAFFKTKFNQEDFEKSGIGASENNIIMEAVRGDFTYWLDENRDVTIKNYFMLLNEIKNILNRYCYLSLSGYEFHLAHYPKGSYYKRHLDQFNHRSNRMITMIVYLNDCWKSGDGGELKMYSTGTSSLVAPIGNRCLLFKSDKREHEVLPTEVGRNSVTGWFLYYPSNVGHILGNN